MADLIGPLLGDRVSRGLPESSTIAQPGGIYACGASKTRGRSGRTRWQAFASKFWMEWGLRTEMGRRPPRPPEADMLAAHDTVTADSRKAQQNFGKFVNRSRRAAHTASLEQLRTPDAARLPVPDSPLRLATGVSLRLELRTACLRARPKDAPPSHNPPPTRDAIGRGVP